MMKSPDFRKNCFSLIKILLLHGNLCFHRNRLQSIARNQIQVRTIDVNQVFTRKKRNDKVKIAVVIYFNMKYMYI